MPQNGPTEKPEIKIKIYQCLKLENHFESKCREDIGIKYKLRTHMNCVKSNENNKTCENGLALSLSNLIVEVAWQEQVFLFCYL